jgi:cytochrome P450
MAEPRTLDSLPGPRGWPVLGNFPQVDFRRFHLQLEEWAERYGECYRMSFGPKKFLVTCDLALAQDLLKDRPDRFGRQLTIEPVFDELGFNGVFSAEGDNWRRQRRVVITALNSAHLNRSFDAMRETTGRLERRWQRAARQGQVLDLPRELMRYTVDITTQLAFGIDFNTLETEGNIIQDDLDRVFPMLNGRLAAPVPWWRWFRLPKDRALDRAVHSVQARIGEIIRECRARLVARPELRESPENFLEAMIVAQEAEQLPFTDRDIVANVFTLLLAGEDTTANTLAWAIKMFMDHPEAFDAVRAEVDGRLGSDTIPVNFAQASDFPLMDAFANETMRLKPVAPINVFGTKRETVLGDILLPAGSGVVLLARRLATREAYFHHADQFQPERWLAARAATGAHYPRAFTPFGGGPRYCPGRNLALLEIRLVLAMVCRNFEFALAKSDLPVNEAFAFTMGPENLLVRLSLRQ